jgi:hypothetical protein
MLSKTIITATLVSAMGLFAEGSTPGGGLPDNLSNLTALGAVILVLIFIVTRMLPALHTQIVDQAKASTAIMADQSKAFAASMVESQVKFADVLDKVTQRESTAVEEISKLRENCAARLAQLGK